MSGSKDDSTDNREQKLYTLLRTIENNSQWILAPESPCIDEAITDTTSCGPMAELFYSHPTQARLEIVLLSSKSDDLCELVVRTPLPPEGDSTKNTIHEHIRQAHESIGETYATEPLEPVRGQSVILRGTVSDSIELEQISTMIRSIEQTIMEVADYHDRIEAVACDPVTSSSP